MKKSNRLVTVKGQQNFYFRQSLIIFPVLQKLTHMFCHSGLVSQSECIHNWSMWDWQSRNSCNIQSVGGGPVNLFTLPRPLSKPTHLEIFPSEMCSTLIGWDIFLGICVSNRVCLSCYIFNLNLQARRELSGNCFLSSHLIRSHL